MDLDARVFLKLAETHAEDAGESDYALGDMDIYLRRAFAIMTPAQRSAFLDDPDVVETMQASDDMSDRSGPDIYAAFAASLAS